MTYGFGAAFTATSTSYLLAMGSAGISPRAGENT
jgi:hypothetical protein